MGYHDSYCEECKQTFINHNALKQHQNSSIHRPRNVRCPASQHLGCTSGLFISVAALARHIDANGCTTFVTRRQFNGIVYDLNQSGDGKRYSVIDPDINPRKISMGISKYDIYLITQEAGQKMLNREDDFWTCTYRGCGAKFNDKDRLKAHLKSPKHEARMYRCPGCDKHFPDLGSACSHIEQDLPRCNLNNVKDVIREAHELIIAVTKKKKDSRTKQRLREFARILPNLRPR